MLSNSIEELAAYQLRFNQFYIKPIQRISKKQTKEYVELFSTLFILSLQLPEDTCSTLWNQFFETRDKRIKIFDTLPFGDDLLCGPPTGNMIFEMIRFINNTPSKEALSKNFKHLNHVIGEAYAPVFSTSEKQHVYHITDPSDLQRIQNTHPSFSGQFNEKDYLNFRKMALIENEYKPREEITLRTFSKADAVHFFWHRTTRNYCSMMIDFSTVFETSKQFNPIFSERSQHPLLNSFETHPHLADGHDSYYKKNVSGGLFVAFSTAFLNSFKNINPHYKQFSSDFSSLLLHHRFSDPRTLAIRDTGSLNSEVDSLLLSHPSEGFSCLQKLKWNKTPSLPLRAQTSLGVYNSIVFNETNPFSTILETPWLYKEIASHTQHTFKLLSDASNLSNDHSDKAAAKTILQDIHQLNAPFCFSTIESLPSHYSSSAFWGSSQEILKLHPFHIILSLADFKLEHPEVAFSNRNLEEYGLFFSKEILYHHAKIENTAERQDAALEAMSRLLEALPLEQKIGFCAKLFYAFERAQQSPNPGPLFEKGKKRTFQTLQKDSTLITQLLQDPRFQEPYPKNQLEALFLKQNYQALPVTRKKSTL